MLDSLRGLLPTTDYSRRGFVVTTLSTGFAMSVQPICAQTAIVTDSAGLTAGEVKIPAVGGDMPAYRAMPAAGGPHPVVLVVQEVFGVHEHIKDVSRRLAKAGYMAIAPELYARQGDPSKITDIRELITNVVAKVPDAQVMGDLDAATAWARGNGGDVAKLAITGFCWGGRIVWLYSAHNPAVKAGVAWYGPLVPPAAVSPLQPKHPVEIAADLKAPVLGLYGAADGGIPVENVEQMKAALKAANKPGEFMVYPDTPHAFNADYRPSYRKPAADDGWKRMLEWFKKSGV